MGVAYAVSCKCGYDEHGLMDGSGMSMQQYAVVACKDCHRLSAKYLGATGNPDAVNLRDRHCKHCRSPRIELYEVPEEGPGVCPRCGEHSLEFSATMLWD